MTFNVLAERKLLYPPDKSPALNPLLFQFDIQPGKSKDDASSPTVSHWTEGYQKPSVSKKISPNCLFKHEVQSVVFDCVSFSWWPGELSVGRQTAVAVEGVGAKPAQQTAHLLSEQVRLSHCVQFGGWSSAAVPAHMKVCVRRWIRGADSLSHFSSLCQLLIHLTTAGSFLQRTMFELNISLLSWSWQWKYDRCYKIHH